MTPELPSADLIHACVSAIRQHSARDVEADLAQCPALAHALYDHPQCGKQPLLLAAVEASRKIKQGDDNGDFEGAYGIVKALLNAGATPQECRSATSAVQHSRQGIAEKIFPTGPLLHRAALWEAGPAIKALLEYEPEAAREKDPRTGSTPLQIVSYFLNNRLMISPDKTDRQDDIRMLSWMIQQLAPYADVEDERAFQINPELNNSPPDPRNSMNFVGATLGWEASKVNGVKEAFAALAGSGHDIDLLLPRENKTQLEFMVGRAVQSREPEQWADQYATLLQHGARLDRTYGNYSSLREYILAQPPQSMLHRVYRETEEALRLRRDGLMRDTKAYAPEMMTGTRYGGVSFLTPFAKSLAEFGLLGPLFAKERAAWHGGVEHMAAHAAAVEALLPERHRDATGLSALLREEALARPEAGATVRYVKGLAARQER